MAAHALFESWRGRYNDSPRVLSEALAEAVPDLQQSWVSTPRGRFPQGTRTVPRHRLRHFLELARCDLLVTNDIVTRHLVKGPRVVYLQTWHGSPIKVIGLHESDPKYRNAQAHRRRMLRDVAKWDYLLSPSRAYSDIYRSAFGYEGEILEFGYPRNDVLINDDGTRRAQVRRALGVTVDQLVVLHAPTWRDDASRTARGFIQPELIDWRLLLSKLPPGTVVLNRLHQHTAPMDLPESGGRFLDVSEHEEISDLILASDVLVADYSSLIYDYALSGRPIILHAPDLAHYRDGVRAFYFDYETWAPGPISSSTEELIDLLTRLDEVEREWAARHRDFVARYCTFEDGRASARVVNLLITRHLA